MRWLLDLLVQLRLWCQYNQACESDLEDRLTPAMDENVDSFQSVLLANEADMLVEHWHGHWSETIGHGHTERV
jgi:hypothetical protein